MGQGSTVKLMKRSVICILILAQFLVPTINAAIEKPPLGEETNSNSSGKYILIGLAAATAIFIGYQILKKDGKEEVDNEDEGEDVKSSRKSSVLHDRNMAPFRTAVAGSYQPRIPIRFYFNIKNIPAQKKPDPRLNFASGREIQLGLAYSF